MAATHPSHRAPTPQTPPSALRRQHEMWGEVAARLSAVLNDDTFRSLEGKTKHQLWLELCDIITRHPRDVEGCGVDVEAVLRGGIRRYTDEVCACGWVGGWVGRQRVKGGHVGCWAGGKVPGRVPGGCPLGWGVMWVGWD